MKFSSLKPSHQYPGFTFGAESNQLIILNPEIIVADLPLINKLDAFRQDGSSTCL
ncbi:MULTISPECIES: hypothetical protein [Pseudomonas]|jgi:hypothetical protein|uniref:hypothetical protein n=1 Tax=Pseudomonas TaxID=286 RepID=UPI00143B2B13|nr:hypothetical protein [Pseudomonas sp. S3E12]